MTSRTEYRLDEEIRRIKGDMLGMQTSLLKIHLEAHQEEIYTAAHRQKLMIVYEKLGELINAL
jgi:hypothetical protein